MEKIDPKDTAAAKAILLDATKRCLEDLISGKIKHVDVARSAARGEKYSSTSLAQFQAFDKEEKRRGTTFDTGTRLQFLFTMPNTVPKLKQQKTDKITYNFTGMYKCAEELAYAEENGLKLHKMYYQDILKKKIV